MRWRDGSLTSMKGAGIGQVWFVRLVLQCELHPVLWVRLSLEGQQDYASDMYVFLTGGVVVFRYDRTSIPH